MLEMQHCLKYDLILIWLTAHQFLVDKLNFIFYFLTALIKFLAINWQRNSNTRTQAWHIITLWDWYDFFLGLLNIYFNTDNWRVIGRLRCHLKVWEIKILFPILWHFIDETINIRPIEKCIIIENNPQLQPYTNVITFWVPWSPVEVKAGTINCNGAGLCPTRDPYSVSFTISLPLSSNA